MRVRLLSAILGVTLSVPLGAHVAAQFFAPETAPAIGYSPGDELELYEGPRLVGRLRVLELFPSS